MSELIDRQDVIDRLKKAEDVFRQNGAKLEANGIHYALELVESDIEIPTVEINTNDIQYAYDQGFKSGYELGKEERPQGKWLKSDIPESVLVKCSICGFDCGAYTHNFCPNCGADMRGGAE